MAGHARNLIRGARNWQGRWRPTPGRVVGVAGIRLYQLTLSGLVGSTCRHLPTCSEYGYEAIARHGLVTGTILTARRVGRCGPFGSAGIDNVPETIVGPLAALRHRQAAGACPDHRAGR